MSQSPEDDVASTIWSAVYPPNSAIPLPAVSLLLTNVAYAGPPAPGRTTVEIHYVDKAGSLCVSYLGSLLDGRLSQLSSNLVLSSVCITGYHLLYDSGQKITWPAHEYRQQFAGQNLEDSPSPAKLPALLHSVSHSTFPQQKSISSSLSTTSTPRTAKPPQSQTSAPYNPGTRRIPQNPSPMPSSAKEAVVSPHTINGAFLHPPLLDRSPHRQSATSSSTTTPTPSTSSSPPKAVHSSQAPSKVKTSILSEDIKAGDGTLVLEGDKVSIYYKIHLIDSRGHKRPHRILTAPQDPMPIVLGHSAAFYGLSKFLVGMHVNGLRRITIPGQEYIPARTNIGAPNDDRIQIKVRMHRKH
ncbi:hypothetical protein ONZ45_g15176 [Pleurotus djamor]|nr:hypothetical protein ONZ45_g15176 [Pleurotus djamor]